MELATSPLTAVLHSLQLHGALPAEGAAAHELRRPGAVAAAFAAERDARILVHLLAAAAEPTTRSDAALRAAVACVDATSALLPARSALVSPALEWIRARAKNEPSADAAPEFSLDALVAEVGRLPNRKRSDEASLAAAVAVQRLVQFALEPDRRVRSDYLHSAVAFAARALALARSKKSADYSAALDAALAELAIVVRAHADAPALAALERAEWMQVPGLAESLAPPA